MSKHSKLSDKFYYWLWKPRLFGAPTWGWLWVFVIMGGAFVCEYLLFCAWWELEKGQMAFEDAIIKMEEALK